MISRSQLDALRNKYLDAKESYEWEVGNQAGARAKGENVNPTILNQLRMRKDQALVEYQRAEQEFNRH